MQPDTRWDRLLAMRQSERRFQRRANMMWAAVMDIPLFVLAGSDEEKEQVEADWEEVRRMIEQAPGVVVPPGTSTWHPDEEGRPLNRLDWEGRPPLD